MARCTHRPRRPPLGLVVGVLCAALLAACTSSSSSASRPHATASSGPYSTKPNIVFVLTDDLSLNLVPYLPHVLAMEQTGTSFSNYSVTDSLCCPSRSSILTGRFPHDTGVYTNDPPDGGFVQFHRSGDENNTFAVALKAAGYRTALMGKYLNGYQVGKNLDGQSPTFVPPGWTDWAGVERGYGEFNYEMNVDGKIVNYGGDPADYLTDVISKRGSGFIESAVGQRKPFLLELASFSPHSPFTPAPQDSHLFPGLAAPRVPSFDRLPTNPPHWLAQAWRRVGLSPAIIDHIDRSYQERVQAVQSVDRMIGSIQQTLQDTGQLSNTVFVFSSDNGYHMGEHGLSTGKLTAFDTDVHVPLIITGPGIPRGEVRDEVVENIDLAPTFDQLGGAPVPSTVDGHSLVPLLTGALPDSWRTTALIEHHGPVQDPGDPDRQGDLAGDPPSYTAIRTADYTFVRYVTGDLEYYDRRTDPWENDNIVRSLSPAHIHQLELTMAALVACQGDAQCWPSARVT